MLVPVTKQSSQTLQLVIAALNEEEGIGLTIAEMKDTLGDIPTLVIDGKSTDRTTELARNMGATVLCQDRAGKGDALAKALQHLDSDTIYIVLTDADFTYPAEYVPEMIKILDKNPSVGMVCGNRFNGKVNKKALHRTFQFGNKLLAFAHKILNGVGLQDPLTGLRVVRASVLHKWRVGSKGFDVEVELNNFVKQQGYIIQEIPIQYRSRIGEKKLKARHGLTIFRRILKESL